MIGLGKYKFKQKKLWPRVLGAVAIIFILSFATLKATSAPSFCGNCHEVQPAVQSWATGPHKNVSCLNCHANPGTLGYVERKIGALNEVRMHLANSYDFKHLTVTFNTTTCVNCHTGKNRSYATKARSIIGESQIGQVHKKILSQNTPCLTCHSYAGHGSYGQDQVNNGSVAIQAFVPN